MLTATVRLRRALPALALLGGAAMVVGPARPGPSATARPLVRLPPLHLQAGSAQPAGQAGRRGVHRRGRPASVDTIGTGKTSRRTPSPPRSTGPTRAPSTRSGAGRHLRRPRRLRLGRSPTEHDLAVLRHRRGAQFDGDSCGGTSVATRPTCRKVEQLLGRGHRGRAGAAAAEPLHDAKAGRLSPSPLGRLVAPGAAVTPDRACSGLGRCVRPAYAGADALSRTAPTRTGLRTGRPRLRGTCRPRCRAVRLRPRSGPAAGIRRRLAPAIAGRQRAAHLLELGARGHLLGIDRGLDAVEEALEPADQLGLGDAQLALGRACPPR